MQQDHSALWERARAGDRDAQLQLARLDLEAGRGARGLKWLRAAVAAGSAEAALVLGQEHRDHVDYLGRSEAESEREAAPCQPSAHRVSCAPAVTRAHRERPT